MIHSNIPTEATVDSDKSPVACAKGKTVDDKRPLFILSSDQNTLENKPINAVPDGWSGGVKSRISNTWFEKLKKWRESVGIASFDKNQNVTFCDYLKLSTGTIEERNESIGELTISGGVFEAVGISIHDKHKGANGYDYSFELKMQDAESDNLFNAGFFFFSDKGQNTGGHLELKGKPCQIMQNEYPEQWNLLLDILHYSGWHISKMDLALDVHGDYAIKNKITIPRLDVKAGKGFFVSDKIKCENKAKTKRVRLGDWSDIYDNPKITNANYDPLKQCMDGLTLYVGSKKSADHWVCYEKTKERLAKGQGLDSENETDLAWVRIEHKMRHTTIKHVPWDAVRNPDKHYSRDRSKLRRLMQRIRKQYKLDKIESILSVTQAKTKNTNWGHRSYWANMHVNRYIADAEKRGLSDSAILENLRKDMKPLAMQSIST